jgi:hypothetical protein
MVSNVHVLSNHSIWFNILTIIRRSTDFYSLLCRFCNAAIEFCFLLHPSRYFQFEFISC